MDGLNRMLSELATDAPDWLRPMLIVALAMAAAVILHAIVRQVVSRAAVRRRSKLASIVLQRLTQPSRWLLIAITLSAINPALGLDDRGMEIWRQISGILTPALLGWLVIALLGVGMDVVEMRADISVVDNLRARQRRTRVTILYQVAVFVVLFVTVCLMLFTIPSIRSIGVTLIASAGLAGLAIGAAAQPALKNLIAGIQLAFTEPIRIDDVVIVEGEWGRIEEIKLTFVVVKTWDERRLIVPISKFLDDAFENWTRKRSELLGTVFLQLDLTADVAGVRRKFDAFARSNEKWDGRVAITQVTDVHLTHMEVRGLVSASDAGRLFDLRCELREQMLQWLHEEMPEALPRRRSEIDIVHPLSASIEVLSETTSDVQDNARAHHHAEKHCSKPNRPTQ